MRFCALEIKNSTRPLQRSGYIIFAVLSLGFEYFASSAEGESNSVFKVRCCVQSDYTVPVADIPVIVVSSEAGVLKKILEDIYSEKAITKEKVEIDLACEILLIFELEEERGLPIEEWDPVLLQYALFRNAHPLTKEILSDLSDYNKEKLKCAEKKARQLRCQYLRLRKPLPNVRRAARAKRASRVKGGAGEKGRGTV